MLNDFILICVMCLTYVYWFNAQKTKEIALATARAHCLAMEVLMLDGYVALNGIWLQRDKLRKIQLRGVAIFAKAFLGIPAQQAAKITRPLMPSAAPAVLLHSLHTQQGGMQHSYAMTRRDVVKPAFSLRCAP
jgi:hypothetical protein